VRVEVVGGRLIGKGMQYTMLWNMVYHGKPNEIKWYTMISIYHFRTTYIVVGEREKWIVWNGGSCEWG